MIVSLRAFALRFPRGRAAVMGASPDNSGDVWPNRLPLSSLQWAWREGESVKP